MKVYELKSSTHDEILNVYKFIKEMDKKLFMQKELGIPRRVKDNWKKVELKKIDGRISGDFIFLESGKGLFLNEKALNVLSEYFENCELLDIYVDGVKHYYINVLDTINCFDKDNSKYRLYEEYGAVIISKYSLLAEKIKENNIFRVSLENIDQRAKPEMDVFVSERFKQTVEEAGLNGFKFVEVPVR